MNLSKWVLLPFLVLPCSFKAMEPAQACLDLGPSSPYSYFSENGKTVLLQTFLTSKTILDDDGNNVLHMAAALHEYPELTQELLLNRPELADYLDAPNKKGITPRDLASRLQKQPINQSALQRDTLAIVPQDFVENVDTSIAIKMNTEHPTYTQFEKVRILKHFQDMRPSKGNTLLHLAAGVKGYPELTQLLLLTEPHLKSAINLINDKGFTALDLANIKGNPEAVMALKAAGAQETH